MDRSKLAIFRRSRESQGKAGFQKENSKQKEKKTDLENEHEKRPSEQHE